jgi:hypothetical protein
MLFFNYEDAGKKVAGGSPKATGIWKILRPKADECMLEFA